MTRCDLEALRAVSFSLIVAGAFAASAAHAAPPNPATANLQVQANVVEICKVAVSADVNFGDVDDPEANDDASGTVSWRCSPGTNGAIALDAGANEATSNDVTTRRMSDGGGNFVSYQLYTDNSYGTIWGDGNNGSSTQAVLGTGISNSAELTVYGRIPANAAADQPTGLYQDTVQVSLSF
jgi:spore coat protein U-like protein